MKSLAYIPGSDQTANASLMTVTDIRAPLATTIQVNTVANAPVKFYGSMGTPHTFTDPVTGETITVVSEATAVDFAGYIDGSNVEIAEIAPGFTDNGSEVGDIIIIRPITEWANNIFNLLSESLDDDGSIKKYFRDQFNDFVEVDGGAWTQSSGLNGDMTAGYVWHTGKRYAIDAISGKAFTASKDTYVDIDPSDNTATYVEVANGATEPAVTADSVRVAKVITDGSGITSVDRKKYIAYIQPSRMLTASEFFSTQPADLGKASRSWATIATLVVKPTITGKMTVQASHYFGYDTSARSSSMRVKVDGSILDTSPAQMQAPASQYAYEEVMGIQDVVAGTSYTITVEANHTSCYVKNQRLTAVVSRSY